MPVYFLGAIVSKTLFLMVCKLLTRFFLKGKEKIYKLPISYFIYTLTSICLIALLMLVNLQYKFDKPMKISMIIISSLLLISLVFIFISYENTAVKNAELFELKSEKQKQELDRKYYQILNTQNENMQTFVHDTKHHLSTILNLSESPEINDYIQSIYGGLEKYNSLGNTNNKCLDIIINEYRTLCFTNGINLEIQIKTANLGFMNPPHLTALLSNILDNAIEAAQKCDNPEIYLSINRNENFTVLTCINSCAEEPLLKKNKMKTTKNDKQLHGFGTKIIAKTVEFYNGNFQFNYNKENKEFSITVLFPEQ